jgi:hypothetical protein
MASVALEERLADVAGPILVKEVRQGLRAKAFAICFGVLLFACLVLALHAAGQVATQGDPVGPKYLALFFAAQSVVCLFVIPFTAYRSMAREIDEETWVLLVLTGLTARRIAYGKASSSLLQALLFASCCAPFVLFSYYLQGIALLTVVAGAVLTFSACVCLVCGAVALGTEGVTRIGRRVTELVALAILLAFTAAAVLVGVWLAKEGSSLVIDRGFWIFVLAIAYVCWSSAWVFLEAAAANLALASETSTGLVRKALLAQHLVALVGAWATSLLSEHTLYQAVAAASIVDSLMLVVAGFFLVSERDGFPYTPTWKVGWAAPGALRGWKLLLGLLFFDCAGWVGLHALADIGSEALLPILAGPAYVGLYLNIGVLLGRAPALARLGSKVATRAGFLVAVATASIMLPVLALMSGANPGDADVNCLNPTLGMLDFLFHGERRAAGLWLLWSFFLGTIPFAYRQLMLHDTGRVG